MKKDKKLEQNLDKSNEKLHISDVIHRSALKKFKNKNTWEWNLMQVVRYDSEDNHSDVCFYVREWLEIIAKQEGYKLVKE
jgi:hypothetical protein